MTLRFDRLEAQGSLVLEESAYGVYLSCPEVHPDQPVALLDLFHGSVVGKEEGSDGPPFQIVFHSPPQTEDPLGRIRYYPDGTRVDFEMGATTLQHGKLLCDCVFGYPEDL